MQLSDDDLFGGECQVSEQLKQSMRYRQREKNYFLAKPDQELFDIFSELSWACNYPIIQQNSIINLA